MRKIPFWTLNIFLFISCLPVFDSMEQMRIVNLTNDTILIGRADYNNIDSVKWFLDHWGAKYDSTCTTIDTTIDNMGNLEICQNSLIPPDSMGCYASASLFGHQQEQKIYFFVITLETARNHSWNDICSNKLYDTLTIQREMLKKGNIIEYRHIF